MTLEDVRNEISRNVFSLDYDQLGSNEKEWVNGEIYPTWFN
jgi:hypothetical protein